MQGLLIRGSPPIRQVAALQVQLILPTTEDLAASQDQGGQFELLMEKDTRARKDSRQTGDGSWQDFSTGGKWGPQQKRAHCGSSVTVTRPTPPSLQGGSELEAIGVPTTSQKPDPQKQDEFSLVMGRIYQ